MESVTVTYNGDDLSAEGDFEKIIGLIEKIIEALGSLPSYKMDMQYEPEANSLSIYLDDSPNPVVLTQSQKDEILEYCVKILIECGANTSPLLGFQIVYNKT